MFTTPVSIYVWNTFQINVGKREEWVLEQNAKVCAQITDQNPYWVVINRDLLSNRFGTQRAKAFLKIMLGHEASEDDCINIIFHYDYSFKYKVYCEEL